MSTILGFFLVIVFSCHSAIAEVRFGSSMVCKQCVVAGTDGSKIIPRTGPRIPPGYEHFPGVGYYRFYPEGAMSFKQAKATCEYDGAQLAIINSDAEEKVLKTLFKRHPKATSWAYLGFDDIRKEGEYITIDGQPLKHTGFTRWSPGQPDNAKGNEDCGSMHRDGGLNDLHCEIDGPWPFFCEYDAA